MTTARHRHPRTSDVRHNPLIPGFNPDPSITEVDGTYYLVTSTFEYLPGLPVYSSPDLVTWTQIGNVATRPEQLQVSHVPTCTGTYAPTIRHRDGVFYVIVTIVGGPRSTVLFTATDPAGPWSDGVDLEGIPGIDPDLAWDEDGQALVTFSGLVFGGADQGHHGIQQVAVDLETGRALESPRSLWSGTGLQFPEAPHLYQRGDDWYLVIAEGGTERGHGVSVARGASARGPFEGHPGNPALSARSTNRAIQSTGHGDMVETPTGTVMVLLGTRPIGAMYRFSPLGRETFVTDVDWEDGWPIPRPVEGAAGDGVVETFDLTDPAALDDAGWLAVRNTPAALATTTELGLRLPADGQTLADAHPRFIGRRQRHLSSRVSVEVAATAGSGGLAVRYDERHWFALEARSDSGRTTVTARACVPGLSQTWTASLGTTAVQLRIETTPPPASFPEALNGDAVRLIAGDGATEVVVAELDGKLWSAEVCSSFTGRVIGLFAVDGEPTFRNWNYQGCDAVHDGPSDCPLHQQETAR